MHTGLRHTLIHWASCIRLQLFYLQCNVYSCEAMKLGAVTAVLNQHTPPSLSEDWDNTGLLVEPCKKMEVTRILLTNDLTENVTREAIETKSQLVIAYHPPIFRPFKRLTQSSAKERILLDCIRHEIAIYSPHSCLDNIKGGVGDWMLTAFNGVGGDHAVSVLKPLPSNDTLGAGRRVGFSEKIPLDKCLEVIKKFLGLKELRLATPDIAEGVPHHPIGSVCVCPGSGASVLRGTSGDLYWTGELSHHDVLDAVSKGRCVVLCEHSNTERGYLSVYRDTLLERLERKVEIIISKTDKEPLSIV